MKYCIIRFVFFVLTIVAITGCGPTKMYSGPDIPNDQIVKLKPESAFIHIISVDNKTLRSSGTLAGMAATSSYLPDLQEVHLSPGPHIIVVRTYGWWEVKEGIYKYKWVIKNNETKFSIDAKPGSNFIVNSLYFYEENNNIYSLHYYKLANDMVDVKAQECKNKLSIDNRHNRNHLKSVLYISEYERVENPTNNSGKWKKNIVQPDDVEDKIKFINVTTILNAQAKSAYECYGVNANQFFSNLSF